MNIALVVHDLHEHGGHSLYTRILADQLSTRHDVSIFANYCERPNNARWNFQPVRAWRINSLSCVKTFPIGMLSQARALERFQIRHMQGYCGGRPNVVTAHRCMAAYLRSLRSISFRHRLSLRLMLAAESRFYRNYDGAVIAISGQIANELQEYYGLRGSIKVIPHGVDVKRFNGANREFHRAAMRKHIGAKDDQTVALYVGDLTKAHSHLKELARATPEVQLVIVTATKSYHWNAPNVRIFPLTTQIERYYAAADSFVFPSLNDPFGMVVLEAMASGLPVFSSDRAGAAELIQSGKDGFVFTLDEWVEATATRLRNRDSLRDVGCAAEKTASRHDWPTVVREVEQLYSKVSGCVADNASANTNATDTNVRQAVAPSVVRGNEMSMKGGVLDFDDPAKQVEA
jgi:UDP-glucose:(heptosyl)LPS alpha-1,3-glucosyltransferase